MVKSKLRYQFDGLQKTKQFKEFLKEQLARQNGCCYYCYETAWFYEVDHIIPLSRDGTNDYDNLVLACQPCNTSKGTKLITEWRVGTYGYATAS